MVKNPPANAGNAGSIPQLGRSPGEGNVPHSSILARRIPWTEEPGGLRVPLQPVTPFRKLPQASYPYPLEGRQNENHNHSPTL